MKMIEKGITRRHTFFCINRERHTHSSQIIEALPKEISVFGRKIQGWLITTEESVIDKVITLGESLQGEVTQRDPE